MRRGEQLVLSALCCCILCLVYPVLSAPVPGQTVTYAEPHRAYAEPQHTSTAYAAAAPPRQEPKEPKKQEPLKTHGYYCQKGTCNTCHYRPSEIRPLNFDAEANGDSAQSRVEGTNVTKAELAEKSLRYLQVGGDWWNKCGEGWLNADFIFTRLPVGFVCEDWRTGRYILRQDAGHRWPFEDGSFDIVYSEHMFEHILPMDGSTFLKEMYRVLKPGGVLRVTTPDLEKYLMGYVNRKTDPFLQSHAARFPPMGKLGPPYTAATVVNNVFRNYEHRWVYDFEEFTAVAVHAGVPREAVTKSSRLGAQTHDLPEAFLKAVREAETVSTARQQKGKREDPTRCWLEQEVREHETLYATIKKPLR